jgi:hypothetical protein
MYARKETIILKPERLNRIGFLFLVAVLIVFGLPMLLIKGWNSIVFEWKFFYQNFIWLTIGGIILHEGLHGLICGIFAPSKFRAIKFGFNKDLLAPYTHCKEPLKGWQFTLGLLTPGILLGIIPCLISLLPVFSGFFIVGLLFTWSAIGDFAIFWAIRNKIKGTVIEDDPNNAGCIVYFM